MDGTYLPIACNFHDRLLHFATTREEVIVGYLDAQRQVQEVKAILVDVFSKGGAEWLRLSNGELIRLDSLVQVAGFYLKDDGYCSA